MWCDDNEDKHDDDKKQKQRKNSVELMTNLRIAVEFVTGFVKNFNGLQSLSRRMCRLMRTRSRSPVAQVIIELNSF